MYRKLMCSSKIRPLSKTRNVHIYQSLNSFFHSFKLCYLEKPYGLAFHPCSCPVTIINIFHTLQGHVAEKSLLLTPQNTTIQFYCETLHSWNNLYLKRFFFFLCPLRESMLVLF